MLYIKLILVVVAAMLLQTMIGQGYRVYDDQQIYTEYCRVADLESADRNRYGEIQPSTLELERQHVRHVAKHKEIFECWWTCRGVVDLIRSL